MFSSHKKKYKSYQDHLQVQLVIPLFSMKLLYAYGMVNLYSIYFQIHTKYTKNILCTIKYDSHINGFFSFDLTILWVNLQNYTEACTL